MSFSYMNMKFTVLRNVKLCILVASTSVADRLAQLVQRLATGLTVRGSNPSGGEIFRTCPDGPWGPPSLLYNGNRLFPGGKERPRPDADPSPPSSAVVMKGQSYTSIPPMGRTACTEPQCLYEGALYLLLPTLQISLLPPSSGQNIFVPQYSYYRRVLFFPEVGGNMFLRSGDGCTSTRL